MKLDKFPSLNTVANSYEIGLDGLTRADNVDLSQDGNISRRAGRTKIYDGVINAAWSDGQDFLFIEGTKLKQLNADYSATELADVLLSTEILYVLRSSMNKLYWSTGQVRGVIEEGVNRAWASPILISWVEFQ